MSCLETIGSVVSGFARLILFVASIIFLLTSLLLFAFTYQSRRDFGYAEVDDINTGLTVLVGLSIYLVVLAVFGIFASFFSSRCSIKLLALMLTLNVIVGIAVLATSSPKLENAHSELEGKFSKYLAIYDWAHNDKAASPEVRNATEAWDNIQTDSHCCGLKSPDDWDKFRPKSLGADMLPLSCCQLKTEVERPLGAKNSSVLYCDRKTEKYWTGGCSGAMAGAFSSILVLVIALISFSFVLDILAAIVIICGPSNP